MTRTIGYVRSALPNPDVCDQQEQALRGAGATEVYRDDGVSGISVRRPAWDRALGALSPGDVLLVTSADRIGRSAQVLRDAVAEVVARGCTLKVVGGPDPAEAVMLADLAGAIDDADRKYTADRIAARRQRRP